MKKKKIILIAIVEIVLLILFITPFFKACDSYEYSFLKMKSWNQYGYKTANGYCLTEKALPEAYSGIFTYNPFYNLRKGSYQITMDYENDYEGNVVYLDSNSDVGYNVLLGNRVLLSPNQNSVTFQVYLKEDLERAQVVTRYEGGTMLIKNVKIQRTRDMDRSQLVTLLFLLSVINTILYLKASGFFTRLNREQVNVLIILSAALAYVCYPLYVDKVIWGSDLVFHLLRIEGLKDSWLAGDFFGKIQSPFLEGYGYATSVFYADTFLTFPAFMRLIGYTIQTSYKVFVFVLNLGLCISSYFCMKEILQNRYIATLGTVLMLYAPSHIFGAFFGQMVGAMTALVFIPMVIQGLYRIYTMDVKDPRYKFNFVLPAIGYFGLLNSHILSTEMVGVFTIFACVICIKKTFRKETFIVLAATVIVAAVSSLGFLVPFLDYYIHEPLKINANPENLWIQRAGFQLCQLLQMFLANKENPDFETLENLNVLENTGLSVLILVGAFVYAYFLSDEKKRKEAKKIWIFLGLGSFALFLSTCYFPWDPLRKILDEINLAFIVDSIQFPTRFMQVATILLIIPGCYGIKILLELEQKELVKGLLAITVGITIVSSGGMVNYVLNTKQLRTQYDLHQFVGRHTWSLEEYAPLNTSEWQMVRQGLIPYDEIEITNYQKKYLDIKMSVLNPGTNESYIDLPLLYYTGYVTEDQNGNFLNTYNGKNNSVVRIDVPAGYSGDVHVYFKQPFVWRAAEVINVFAGIVFIFGIVAGCRKKIF